MSQHLVQQDWGARSHKHGSHLSQACINQRQPDRTDNVAPEKVRRPSVRKNEGNDSEIESELREPGGKEDGGTVH